MKNIKLLKNIAKTLAFILSLYFFYSEVVYLFGDKIVYSSNIDFYIIIARVSIITGLAALWLGQLSVALGFTNYPTSSHKQLDDF